MASISVASLERGEYQPVAIDKQLPDAPMLNQSWWRRPALSVSAAVGALVIVCTAIIVFHGGSQVASPTKSQLHETEVKTSILTTGATENEKRVERLNYEAEEAHDKASGDEAGGGKANARDAGDYELPTTATTTSTVSHTVTSMTTAGTITSTATDLVPDEQRHDGNSCEDHEENFLGLCYKTCDELTNGEYPVRSSPFHCCKTHDCFDHEKRRTWIPCAGYDINARSGCPHAPGACLVDEELLAGLCYKKCSILTNGSHPTRTAPATCCKGWKTQPESWGAECLDFVNNDWTKGAYAVGGGQGDGHPSTPGKVHGPLHNLTEGSALVAPALYEENITKHNQVPDEHRHDGNHCEDNEEILAGLCYKKCSILTGGEYPQRSTAFTCCKTSSCFLQQSMGGDLPIPCQGYDVSGHDGCPHAPGGCLQDEELFLGLCYAKCTLLTKGDYRYRVAPLTCCKVNDEQRCLDPFSKDEGISDTNSAYEIAGGGGDNINRTPGHVHGPLRFVTEAA